MVSDFPKKQKNNDDNLLLKGLITGFVILMLVLVVANFKLYQKKKYLAVQLKNYADELKRIENDNIKLKKEIDNTENIEYIEKVAREENNMKKPGEKVVSFIMPKEAEVNKLQENKSWTAGLASFWQGILGIFK
jgi:cell division protein FtsB